MKNLLSFNGVCKTLSISDATLNNWIRLNKISYIFENGKYYFEKDYINNFTETSGLLRSRRNKTLKNGNVVCNGYIENSQANTVALRTMVETFSEFSETEIRLILGGLAIKILVKANKINLELNENFLNDYLCTKIDLGIYESFIDDIIGEIEEIYSTDKVKFCLSLPIEFKQYEDFIGFSYMCLKNISKRKSSGMYYTPSKITKKVISSLDIDLNDKKILDPCCGSGNFLLEVLKNNCEISNIYGCDNDFISIAIARFNIALNCNTICTNLYDLICENIVCCDFLSHKFSFSPNIIIGNPPWGFNFSKEDKLKLSKKFVCSKNKSFDSFDIFTEKSLSILNDGGIFSFVLPQSIINVKSHAPIREIILKDFSFIYAGFFEKAFDTVICPSVVLTLKKEKQTKLKCRCENDFEQFEISKNRNKGLEFLINISDEEYNLIEKSLNLQNAVFLKENCTYALGIVTGNNKKYIINEKKLGYEPILKGNDVNKFT